MVEAGLLHCRDDRYHLNDLVRLFAAERLDDPDPDGHVPYERSVRGRSLTAAVPVRGR